MLEIHLRQGKIGAALRQYEDYRALLHDELGPAPGLRITTLMCRYVTKPQTRTRQENR